MWNKLYLLYQQVKKWHEKKSANNSGSGNLSVAVIFYLFAMIISWLTPAIIFGLITYYTGMWFVDLLGNFVGLIHALLALAIFSTIIMNTYKWFIVIVPEFIALGALNMRTRIMNVYFQGLNIKLPWEQVKKDNYVSLQKITVEFQATDTAGDGSEVIMNGFVQYRCKGTKEAVIAYIGTEDKQIVVNILGKVKNHLTKDIAREDYKEVRQKIMDLGKDLSALYDEKPGQPSQMNDIQNECGILVERIVVSSVEFGEGTKAAITSRFEMETLRNAPEPTDRQLIMLNKKVTKHVFGFDFGTNAEVARTAIGAIEKVMTGPAGAAIAVAAATKAGTGDSSSKKPNLKGGR